MAKLDESTLLQKAVNQLKRKITLLFSISGFKEDVLPGIYISVIPAFLLLEQYRDEFLTKIGLGGFSFPADHIIVGLIAILIGIASWFVSGWIFDPIFDVLYGNDKRFTKLKRDYGPFKSGFALNDQRKKARDKISEKDADYKDERYSIFKPICDVLKRHHKNLYTSYKTDLVNSKTIRNSLLPLSGLIISTYLNNEFLLSASLALLVFILFFVNSNLRQTYMFNVYKMYNNKDVPTL